MNKVRLSLKRYATLGLLARPEVAEAERLRPALERESELAKVQEVMVRCRLAHRYLLAYLLAYLPTYLFTYLLTLLLTNK